MGNLFVCRKYDIKMILRIGLILIIFLRLIEIICGFIKRIVNIGIKYNGIYVYKSLYVNFKK